MKYRYLATAAFMMSLLCLSGCKVGRFIWFNFADIKDYKIFPARSLHPAATPFHFYYPEVETALQPMDDDSSALAFDDFLRQTQTVAFLVIRNDTLLYERYLDDYDEASIVPSFSMAKSVTSMLIGCAIADGFISSVHDPVTRYIPELRKNGFDQVTIEHLLQMTSGLHFNEGYYNPLGHVATFYYGRRLREATLKLKLETEPGQRFAYASGNTQLLGLILDRVLQGETITEYLDRKIWQPLGMEYDASWSIDRKEGGLEKTFCCLNARARDFAKLGRLYLHQGNWEGKQLVPATWVQQSTQIDTAHGSEEYYQYQWWLPTPNGDFLARGILGQYIYVHPAKNLIIVRLGKKVKANWPKRFVQLAKEY